MKKIVIDCCELPLNGAQDSRVSFEHVQLDGDDPVVHTVRQHCPLSVAMQVIAFNESVPNGFRDSYLLDPEKSDSAGHVEK